MTAQWYRRPAIVASGLGLAVAIVYAQVLGFEFVEWDDPAYVIENPAVQGGLTWRGIVWAFTTWHAANWHPLTWLSHMLDQQLFGGWAGGHHLTSVVLHATNSVLLYLLLLRATGASGRSAVVAGLFALHPLHVESVAWVSERKDVLSTCLAFAALLAWVDWATARRWRSYALALGAFVLACLAKPMVVTLPGVLVLLDIWPLRRLSAATPMRRAPAPATRAARRAAARGPTAEPAAPIWSAGLVLEKLPFVALSIAVSLVTLVAQGQGGAIAESNALPLAQRLTNALISYVAYAWTAIWPSGLAFFYPYRPPASVWLPIGAAAALVAATLGALRVVRSHPYVLVGWLWYLGTLVPVIGLVQVGDLAMADRHTYVPLVGLFVIVAWGAVDLAARWRLPPMALRIAGGAVLTACAVLSARQATIWRASVPLFERGLAVTRDNYVAHNLLGFVLFMERRLDEAASHFATAVALLPTMHEAHNNLGLVRANQGRFAEAIPHYQTALQIRPGFVTARFNLAIALDRTGASSAATAEAERAMELARAQGNDAVARQITQWLAGR